MYLRVSISLYLVSWVSTSFANGSNIRFPSEDESDKTKGGVKAEERYSDTQASAVVMQPTAVKRLPHFIMPQVPGGVSPFGQVNPGGYAEGIILNQPSGRPPPNRHYKPNIKQEKMKQAQRVPYRVMAKPPTSQVQTRKPLFVPKGPPSKDIHNHPDLNKYKIKHPHFNKEQEFHHNLKIEALSHSDKEMAKIKNNKYFMKGVHLNHEVMAPYKFLPTVPPPEQMHQNFDNRNKEKVHMDKHINTSPSHFPTYQPHGEYPQYFQHQNYKESDNQKNSFHEHYAPVQEHIEEPAYINQKDHFAHFQTKTPVYENHKIIQPSTESLVDYISKWSGSNKYDTKYRPFKEWSELEEANFEKAWLSASEWVPIHAPAPPSIQENLQSYQTFDNNFGGSNTFANMYPETLSFTHRQGFTDQLQNPSHSFSNALVQSSTVPNTFPNHQLQHAINPYDLKSPIFQKPEVVIGKRPKSADINNSHEVSAVFMVKQ